MGGRGTVQDYRYTAQKGHLDILSGSVPITKTRRGRDNELVDKETRTFAPRVLEVGEGSWGARLTKKEARLVAQVQDALTKSRKHTIINDLPKDFKINKVHVEDKVEWYVRNKKKEMKGAKDPYNMSKDAPFVLKKTKDGVTLVVTYSATQQGMNKLNNRFKNSKGVARNVEEAILREQAKLVYNNLKRTNPSTYDIVHQQLIKYNTRPTSKNASNSIKKRGSTVETFADAYVLNASKRKTSLGKQQRAVVRGTMYWLGDLNYNRNHLGHTTKLVRLEDKYKKNPLLDSNQAYKGFIEKYTKKR